MLCGFTVVHNRNPEVDTWGTLFIDGLKLMIVGLLYAIPVFYHLGTGIWQHNSRRYYQEGLVIWAPR